MRPLALLILPGFLTWFAPATHAIPRTSPDYTLAPESTNGGGQRTASASYSHDGTLGEMGGLATASTPAVAASSGYIGALEIVGVVPTVTTVPANGVTGTGAFTAGEVTDDGGSEIITRGVVWSTSPDPTLENGTPVAASAGTGLFIVPLSGLSPGTTHHFRAFATTMVGTGYGANAYFTTDTGVNFVGDLAGFSRTILASDRHVFTFAVTGPRIVSFTTTGGATLRASLFNGQGDLVASFDGDSDINLKRLLLAGNYALHVYREPGAGAPQTLALEIDAGDVATTRPDVAVGASPSGLLGVGLYAPSTQLVTLTSKKAKSVTVHASIANRGKLPDVLAVNATRGSAFFKVLYIGPAGNNITAGLVSGAHRTIGLDEGAAAVAIRAKITPNKLRLTRVQGGRTFLLKKTFTTLIGVRSTTDATKSDIGSIRVQTR